MTRHPLRQRRTAGIVATATLLAALVAAAPNTGGTDTGSTVGTAHDPVDVFVLSAADAASGVRWD